MENEKAFESDDEGDPRICDKHWRCPKCGCGVHVKSEDGERRSGFMVENDEYDCVRCGKCGGCWTFRGVERAILRKNDMVKCPTCKGTGAINKKKMERMTYRHHSPRSKPEKKGRKND